MSNGTEDKDYKARHKISTKRRTPGRTRQEVDQPRTYGYESDGGISTFVDEWTPEMETNKVSKTEEFLHDLLGEENNITMAKQTEKSSMDNMLEMFMRMREDEMERDERREQDRLAREERKKKERVEMEERRELDRIARDENVRRSEG